VLRNEDCFYKIKRMIVQTCQKEHWNWWDLKVQCVIILTIYLQKC